ncbi:hypothetical protein GH714_024403 [Hevea brasiliensis]|uniref:non-specific serine/threonine protein kinase n=1 Tax=Hevea brasiliensis TaxID=3981 RepID=A0A6A6MCR6_HEVBR|nr:hypothetical protein GH714_024403 [Hevea brasiliensis]
MTTVEEKVEQLECLPPEDEAQEDGEGEGEGEEEELSWSSGSEIGDALDWLDSKEDEDAVDGTITLNSRRPNAHGGIHSRSNSSTLQPLSNRNQKFSHHIRASPLEAIDPRTRMVLFKMLNRVYFMTLMAAFPLEKRQMYHATKSDDQELAIKVYKTSVLVLRTEIGMYKVTIVLGMDTASAMLGKWLKAAGIRCPTPYLLRLHVLVMEFIGKAGWAAPRLKDAVLSLDKLHEGYAEMIIAMRTLYQKCKLVHGDLSEYNILYFEGHLYVIDVSQAVDLDHPRALDFLREDCVHISVQQKILSRDVTAEDEIADSVFVQSYIPKTLDHVKNAEEDVIRITSSKDTKDMYYHTITGLKEALSKVQSSAIQNDQKESSVNEDGHSNAPESGSDSETDDEENSSESDESGSLSEVEKKDPLDKKTARKENKKKVKEEKREARKTKIPKAVKKRTKKLAKAKKTR